VDQHQRYPDQAPLVLVTLNLAFGLSSLGLRVGVFDADLYGPNVPYLLGIRRRTSATGMVTIARVDRAPYIKPVQRYGLAVMFMRFVLAEADAVVGDAGSAGRSSDRRSATSTGVTRQRSSWSIWLLGQASLMSRYSVPV
jgi:hypothetical protein